MISILEHPEIGWMEATGYPSWAQDRRETENADEDLLLEQCREGDWEE